MSSLFEVDIKGFKQTLADDAPRILIEPISNALDTEATEIHVAIGWERGVMLYTVTDNDPEGFANLADAWTLFAPSRRADKADKRGRFGYGEKEFIALAWPGKVTISSTLGAVTFDGNKRTRSSVKREAGSQLHAEFRLTHVETIAFVYRVRQLLIPDGVKFRLTVSVGKDPAEHITEVLAPRPVLKSVSATLPTVMVDNDGNLRPTRRSAKVDILVPAEGEKPTIYELGIPVVVHDGQFHVNIGQKVPLTRDRDNVTAAYLRQVRELVLDNTFDLLTPEEAKKAWVTDALPKAKPEAVKAVVFAIHGEDAVIFDPSNHEANKLAMDEGRTVVHGRQFSAEAWKAIKGNDILKPAGHVVVTEPHATPAGTPPLKEWSVDMTAIADYAYAISEFLYGQTCVVQFVNAPNVDTNVTGRPGHFAAWFYPKLNVITFNLGVLGKRWPAEVAAEKLDALLIHEFAHMVADDHTSAAFYEACCAWGAKLRSCPTRWKR